MQKHTFNVLGVLLATALLVLLCVGGASADWPTYMGNDGRTGYTSEEGPSTNNVLWSIDGIPAEKVNGYTAYGYYQAPIVDDGKIYVSSYHYNPNYCAVFCYDQASGALLWEKKLDSYTGGRSGMTLSGNYLYLGAYDGTNKKGGVVCLDITKKGEVIGDTKVLDDNTWNGITATPLIVGDHVWIHVFDPCAVYVYDKELKSGQKIEIPIPNGGEYASISTNGTDLYIPGNGGVIAYNVATMTQTWTLDVNAFGEDVDYDISTPAYHNGNISIIVSNSKSGGKLYSINVTTGTENWNKTIVSAVTMSSPAVCDSAIIVSNKTGIVAYSPENGAILWKHEGKSASQNSPVIAGDMVYYGSSMGGIYAVKLSDGTEIWNHNPTYPKISKTIEGSLAIADGKLYYGDNMKFYAIGEPTSLFDGTVKLGTEKVDIQLNDGVYLRTVEGTSVMAAIHAAAEKGGFDYNVTCEEGKFSLKGFAGINNNTIRSWVVYCGNTPIDINTYTLNDGDTLNIYFCKYVGGAWKIDDPRSSVTIIVDVPAAIPTAAAKIYDGSVALKTGSVPIAIDEDSKKNVGENTVLGVLDTAAKAGGFTYNVTYDTDAFSLKNISGYGDNTWKLYINGEVKTDSIDTIEVKDGDHIAFYSGEIDTATHYVIITAKEKPSSFTLTLKSGWNFVSVPQTLATDENTVEKVFGSVLGDGGVLTFDGNTQSWIKADKDTVIKPLEAYWVDAKAGTSVDLTYNTNDPTVVPSSKKLHEGWNAVGISADDDITVDEFLGTYNNWHAIIPWNSVSQDFASQINKGNSNTQTLEQGAGNWLYVSSGNSLIGSL